MFFVASVAAVISLAVAQDPPVFYFAINGDTNPDTPLALDFGEWATTVSQWPSLNTSTATVLVYRDKMAGWFPIQFTAPTHTTFPVPVLAMHTVPFCYKTYDQHLAPILIGSPCQDHVVYRADKTIVTYPNVSALWTATQLLVHGDEKLAMEYNPATPLRLTTYRRSTDIDTVSSMTVPLVLVLFLTSWLGWTKAISYHSMRKPGTPVPNGLWHTLCESYGVIVLDIVVLCVATYGLDVHRGFAILRGGEAMDLVGLHTADRLAYGWVFVLGLLLTSVVAGLVYGYQYTDNGQTILQSTDSPPPSLHQWLLGVLMLVVVGASSYAIVLLENIHATWLIVIVITSSIVIMLLTLRYRQVYRWWDALVGLQQHTSYDTPYLLMLRWSVQTIVLTTLHATLPITLDEIRSTTYRNGVGFVLGCMISGTAGRDVVWLLQHEHCQHRSRKLLALQYLVAAAMVSCMVGYISVFMVGPVFIGSRILAYHATSALLGAIAITTQALAGGIIYAVLRTDTTP
jgi:hypothetical protein